MTFGIKFIITMRNLFSYTWDHGIAGRIIALVIIVLIIGLIFKLIPFAFKLIFKPKTK